MWGEAAGGLEAAYSGPFASQRAVASIDMDAVRRAYASAMHDTTRKYGRGEASARDTARALLEFVDRNGKYATLVAWGECCSKCQNVFELMRMVARCYGEVADREEAQAHAHADAPILDAACTAAHTYHGYKRKASEVLVSMKASLYHTMVQVDMLEQRGIAQALSSIEKIMLKREWWSVVRLFYMTAAAQLWEEYRAFCVRLREELRVASGSISVATATANATATATAATLCAGVPTVGGEWPVCRLDRHLTPLALGSTAPCNVDPKWGCAN